MYVAKSAIVKSNLPPLFNSVNKAIEFLSCDWVSINALYMTSGLLIACVSQLVRTLGGEYGNIIFWTKPLTTLSCLMPKMRSVFVQRT